MKAKVARVQNSVTIQLRRDSVQVEETDDAWIISGTGMTAAGVQNRAQKTREELRKTWRLANGVPFTHDHPGPDEFGLVVDRRRIAGWTQNARWDDAGGVVAADVVLLKRSVPGLDVHEQNVILNRRLIAAMAAGETVEVSIGFWSTDEWLPADSEWNGEAFDRVQRDIIYDHLAAVPKGACNWGAGCGLGRWQNGVETKEKTHMEPENPQKAQLAHNCAGGDEAQRRLASALQDAADAKKAALELAGVVKTLESNATTRLDKIEKASDRLVSFLDQQDKLTKGRLDGKREKLGKLLNKKPEEIPASMDEQALDLLIERETGFRGRADGTRIRNTQTGDEVKPVNGIIATENGATVATNDWWKKPAGVN